MSVEPFPRPFHNGEPIPFASAGPSRALEPGGLIRRWWRRWRHRRALAHLVMTQPDSVLEDLGFTRADATYEANKPFWLG